MFPTKHSLLETGGAMPDETPSEPAALRKLYGGRLCLDFANTVEPRAAEPRRDTLTGYDVLVAWAHHAGAIDDATAARLREVAAGDPAAARASLAEAVALREASYRVFAAIAHGAAPEAADLRVLQRADAEAMRHASLVPDSGRYALAWDDAGGELDRAWWPIARSAVELLTAGPLERVKQCAGRSGCGFLFLDTSRNRVRRWCSMEECGWQEKASLQTARRRAARTRHA
jgi:predicted RNA-binding Zn ribbon-like protein